MGEKTLLIRSLFASLLLFNFVLPMASLSIKRLGQLAPDLQRRNEQTEKIEEALPSQTSSDVGSLRVKPRLEDFVFFAAAQREAEREADGIT